MKNTILNKLSIEGFKKILVLELYQIKNTGIMILTGVLAILLLFLAIFSMIGYHNELIEISQHCETEKARVSNYVNVTQYANYGIIARKIPAPQKILFGGIFRRIESSVDSSERMPISLQLCDEQIFAQNHKNISVCGFLAAITLLLSLLLGFKSYHKSFMMLLTGQGKEWKVILSVGMARIVLINGYTILLFLVPFLTGIIAGYDLFHIGIGLFLLVLIFGNSLFVISGMLIETITRKTIGLISILVFYAVSVFGIPWLITEIVITQTSTQISSVFAAKQKLELLGQFEDSSKKIIAKCKQKGGNEWEVIVKQARYYLNNEYKEIQKIDDEQNRRNQQNIQTYYFLSALCPTSFLFATIDEIGGEGYQGFLQYYAFNQKYKDGFIRFFFDKKYFNPPAKESKIVDYTLLNPNTHQLRSDRPDFIEIGFGVFTVCFAILFYGMIRRKSTRIFERIDANTVRDITICLKKFQTVGVMADNRFLYGLAECVMRESGTIQLVGIPKGDKRICYLPHPERLPNIRVCDWVRFLTLLLGLTPDIEAIRQIAGTHWKQPLDSLDVLELEYIILLTVSGSFDVILIENYLCGEDSGRMRGTETLIKIRALIDQMKEKTILLFLRKEWTFSLDDIPLVFEWDKSKAQYTDQSECEC